MMTRNGRNRWVFYLAPTESCYTKSEEYFAKAQNCDIAVLAAHPDFGDISEVWEVSVSKHERRNDRMGNIENTMANLKDMPTSYLPREVDMFSG